MVLSQRAVSTTEQQRVHLSAFWQMNWVWAGQENVERADRVQVHVPRRQTSTLREGGRRSAQSESTRETGGEPPFFKMHGGISSKIGVRRERLRHTRRRRLELGIPSIRIGMGSFLWRGQVSCRTHRDRIK